MQLKQKLIPATALAAFAGGLAEVGAGAVGGIQKPLQSLKGTLSPDGTGHNQAKIADVFQPYLDQPFNTIMHGMSTDLFHQAQPLCAGLALGAFSWFLIKNMKNNRPADAHEYNSHGSTRWATKYDIFDNKDITDDLDAEAILLAKYNKKKHILLNESTMKNKNVAVFGGAGTGKTQGLIKPNIVKITDRSLVVTDPKGELYESTAKLKRLQGFSVQLVNFSELDYSIRYNSLGYIKRPSDANKVVESIVSNSTPDLKTTGDFWGKAEKSLLSALILYVKYVLKEEQQHMGSVYELLTSPYEYIHFLYLSLPDEHIAKRAYYQAISKLQGKTAADVFTTAAVTLDLWKYPEVCEFTFKNDFDFADLAHKKTIVYVILPIAEDRFRPLISTFFDQMFGELYKVADQNNNKLPVKVKFLIDEFCNIGRLPQFQERLSTMRSYGMSVMLVIQSLGQLRHRWGKDPAEEIIDNCDTRIYLGANNTDSAEYFAKMIGRTTIEIDSSSSSTGKSGSSSSSSSSYTGKQLMMAEDLQRLDDDTLIVLMRTKMPMKVRKAWLHEIKELNSQLGEMTSRFDFPVPDRTGYEVFKPRQLIKKLVEANGGKALDLADFQDKSEMIINSADPEYQLKKAKEERAQAEAKKKEAKSKQNPVQSEFEEALDVALVEASKKLKKTKKQKKQETAPPPPQVEEYGGYTDADAPPENTDEILPYEPFTSEPFPFEEEAPKPV
ncbi:VirD4-like conjugal transfer protein, CD1115 family, partial [Priestia megaterium]|uniref:VirD4-like conjugal transfer protein, CD1115 family n=1 Tax=Priestia megaterium TaxID=1404 RepID=UPI0031FBC21C